MVNGHTTSDIREKSMGAKDARGNVIVSVRVRPDVSEGEGTITAKDWTIDSRRSLISYKAGEGGDYRYGRHTMFY